MNKHDVKVALENAILEYNEEMEGYIINCDESEKANLRKLAATTMECFSDFEKVIIEIAD